MTARIITLGIVLFALSFSVGCSADTQDESDSNNTNTRSKPVSEEALVAKGGPRLCSEKTWEDAGLASCISIKNDGVTFAVLARALAKRAEMSEEEFISLNKWEEYLAYTVEPGVSYLYVLTQEGYVKANSADNGPKVSAKDDEATHCQEKYDAALCVCSSSEEEQRARGEVYYTNYRGFVKVGSELGDINIVDVMGWQDRLDDPIPSGVCAPVRSKDWKPRF